MANEFTSDVLNIGYLGTLHDFDNRKLDRVLRSIIDLSTENSVYSHDEITVSYRHVGPLHFDFLNIPVVLRYNTGIILLEKVEKPVLLQSQGILLDFGAYDADSKSPDGHQGHNLLLVWATKEAQKPTVYMVHGIEEEVEMDLLRSKMKLDESDILMVNDPNKQDSLKKILQKLVEISLPDTF